MAASTGVVALARKPLAPLVRRDYEAHLLATGVVYGVLLRRVVRHWED
ncbi:MAG: hypothetical protein Q4C85_04430 [Actinomyces sp.]|nr:hypothetical protein [Actinomyces sp.]MDO4242995.1 hypothetical protein [Actinomyces sp.]